MEEIEKELGKMVLATGQLEMSLRSTILSFFGQKNIEMCRSFLLPNNNFSTNINILNRIINNIENPEYKTAWTECIQDLNNIFSYRNRIFHSMYGVKNKEIFFFHVKKGKNGKKDEFKEIAFNLKELKDNNIKLSTRHRQLMDFIENMPQMKTSHKKYPLLKR